MIARYNMSTQGCIYDPQMEPDSAGGFVRYEDHVAAMNARHTLSPADTIPHTPCKSCAGTCIGEQDGGRLISRCVQCRREAV